MDTLVDMCTQIAVYWEPNLESPSGQPLYTANPVEITVRWEQSATVFIDRNGNEATSKAEVFVLEPVLELGALWLSPYSTDDPEGCALQSLAEGSINQTPQNNPFNNPGTFEIRRYEEVPTFNGESVERCAYL